MTDKKKTSRSAVDGKFVSKEEAEANPETTVTETSEAHVTHHLDRRDSGTNWNESKQLPSLDDDES